MMASQRIISRVVGNARRIKNQVLGQSMRPKSAPNVQTIEFLKTTQCRRIAEIGVEWGSTSEQILGWLNGQGSLHLYDFERTLQGVSERLSVQGFTNFRTFGNSTLHHDSYNWSLIEPLRSGVRYDYVFLDGAHTWQHDALAFLLIDRMLETGGYIDFDDYDWTIDGSPSTNPRVYPENRKNYTQEQMETKQVKLIVDLLVRGHGYEEVVKDKIFRKL